MSFARILRSSALMGGAQVVVLAAGFVRTKIIAMILGASGVGLIGIFNAFSGNVSAFAGWGLGTSGVRLVAGADEEAKPAKLAAVRRMGWILSLLGLALGLLAFVPVGLATFDSNRYALELAVVALAVPCIIASSAWSALLQATGRVSSLAKVQIASACAGLLLGLPAIYFWGTVGIAVSIFLAAAVPAAVLWRAASAECPARGEIAVEREDLRQLAKVGAALMIVGWLGQFSAYLVRLAIVRQEGLDAAGYYQAAFAISGSLPGFVFAAMGADFFPRVAAAKDEAEARFITEKQIQAGLLLGLPLIVLLLTLGKFSIRLLYANGFEAAIPLLSWMAWGVFVRLFAWPLAFWLLARGSAKAMILVEGVSALAMAAISVYLLDKSGLVGCAAGFFFGQVFYAFILTLMALRRSTSSLDISVYAWLCGAALFCVCSQIFTSKLSGDYWGIVPFAVSAGVCGHVFWKMRHNL